MRENNNVTDEDQLQEFAGQLRQVALKIEQYCSENRSQNKKSLIKKQLSKILESATNYFQVEVEQKNMKKSIGKRGRKRRVSKANRKKRQRSLFNQQKQKQLASKQSQSSNDEIEQKRFKEPSAQESIPTAVNQQSYSYDSDDEESKHEAQDCRNFIDEELVQNPYNELKILQEQLNQRHESSFEEDKPMPHVQLQSVNEFLAIEEDIKVEEVKLNCSELIAQSHFVQIDQETLLQPIFVKKKNVKYEEIFWKGDLIFIQCKGGQVIVFTKHFTYPKQLQTSYIGTKFESLNFNQEETFIYRVFDTKRIVILWNALDGNHQIESCLLIYSRDKFQLVDKIQFNQTITLAEQIGEDLLFVQGEKDDIWKIEISEDSFSRKKLYFQYGQIQAIQQVPGESKRLLISTKQQFGLYTLTYHRNQLKFEEVLVFQEQLSRTIIEPNKRSLLSIIPNSELKQYKVVAYVKDIQQKYQVQTAILNEDVQALRILEGIENYVFIRQEEDIIALNIETMKIETLYKSCKGDVYQQNIAVSFDKESQIVTLLLLRSEESNKGGQSNKEPDIVRIRYKLEN